MQLQRFENNPILTANKKYKWEAGAVFNCSVCYNKEKFHLVYRAIASGFYPKKEKWGKRFGNYVSSIGYAISKDGMHFERRRQLIRPEYEYEKYGCEDPRITKLDDTYYIFYTTLPKPASYVEESIRIALATTKDLKKIKKHGVIGPNIKSKAAALFPEKIKNKIGMLLTLFPDTPKSTIVYASFDNTNQLLNPKNYWEEYSVENNIVLSSPDAYRGPEVGALPLKTKKGWLLIYCGPSKKRVWSISAVLLDLKNPKKNISKPKEILRPEKDYECKGLVPNVTFPSGAVIVKGNLFVYYGAADKTCCLATCNLRDLLKSLI